MKKQTEQLTRAEIDALGGAPEEIKQFVAERRNIEVRTSAYRKIAAAARAEREALMEVRLLALVKLSDDPANAVAARTAERDSARTEATALRRRVAELEAGPAMAVHSQGTGR